MSDATERLRAQLREHGDQRRQAREADRREMEAIAKLLPDALAAGISKREITRLTGISRPWIERLMANREDSAE
jgi:hypothetical protein